MLGEGGVRPCRGSADGAGPRCGPGAIALARRLADAGSPGAPRRCRWRSGHGRSGDLHSFVGGVAVECADFRQLFSEDPHRFLAAITPGYGNTLAAAAGEMGSPPRSSAGSGATPSASISVPAVVASPGGRHPDLARGDTPTTRRLNSGDRALQIDIGTPPTLTNSGRGNPEDGQAKRGLRGLWRIRPIQRRLTSSTSGCSPCSIEARSRRGYRSRTGRRSPWSRTSASPRSSTSVRCRPPRAPRHRAHPLLHDGIQSGRTRSPSGRSAASEWLSATTAI